VTTPRAAVAAAVTGLVLGLTACGSGEDSGGATASAPSSPPAVETSAAPAPEGPFGPGCSAVPPSGAGSFADMAGAPVVTAASRNPLISSLARGVQRAGLVESFNGAQDVTVLAPANAAFEAVPAADLQALLADTPRLTAVLTHHVIQGRIPPGELAGTHTTLNNDEVTIEGSGEDFTITAEQTVLQRPAAVVCGNVETANATVYIVDQVLVPPAG
jgi:uncharacterized surface protein with fasciclin (FAS1) repeats